MKLFFEGVGVATVLIIAAEIKFNYALGDKVKDVFLFVKGKLFGLFGKKSS